MSSVFWEAIQKTGWWERVFVSLHATIWILCILPKSQWCFGYKQRSYLFSSKGNTKVCKHSNASAVKLNVLSCHFDKSVNKQCNLIKSAWKFLLAKVAPKWLHLRLHETSTSFHCEAHRLNYCPHYYIPALNVYGYAIMLKYIVCFHNWNDEVTTWQCCVSKGCSTTVNTTCSPSSQTQLIPTINIWKCFQIAMYEQQMVLNQSF